VLLAADVDTRTERIVAHLKRMEAQLAETQSVVRSLRALLERPAAAIEVEHRSVGPVRVLAIAEQVSATALDDWWDAAFRALDTAAEGRATGARGALFSAEYFELEVGEVIAYLPVPADLTGAGRIEAREIPAAELAVAVHHGGLADLDRTYGA